MIVYERLSVIQYKLVDSPSLRIRCGTENPETGVLYAVNVNGDEKQRFCLLNQTGKMKTTGTMNRL